jgi:hypothetical protein
MMSCNMYLYFWWYWHLNSGLHAARQVITWNILQPFLLCYIMEIGSCFLPKLAWTSFGKVISFPNPYNNTYSWIHMRTKLTWPLQMSDWYAVLSTSHLSPFSVTVLHPKYAAMNKIDKQKISQVLSWITLTIIQSL